MKFVSLKRACIRILTLTVWFIFGLIFTLSLNLFFESNHLPLKAQPAETPSTVPTVIEPASLEQQAQSFYETGQFLEALRIWQQLLQNYQTQDDQLNQARIFNNLALAYQQLGDWTQANAAIEQSLKLQKKAKGSSQEKRTILAQTFNNKGSLQLALGQPEQALETWQKAVLAYKQAGDEIGMIRSLINQSLALKSQGLYRRALTVLTQTNQRLANQPNSLLKATVLNSLGNTLRLIGDLDQSQEVLQQSLAIAQEFQSPTEIAAAFLSLGDTASIQQDFESAQAFYQQASTIAPSQLLKIRANLNQFSLFIETEQWLQAQSLWPKIQPEITNLQPSQASLYAKINFAKNLIKLKQETGTPAPEWSEIAQLLANTAQQAERLGDRYSQSYALGSLGQVYEQTQQWSIAETLTQEALLLSQAMNASDISYRWYEQLGRLYKTQGNLSQAIVSYSQAVEILQLLRSDLVAINPGIQVSFREDVEPIYRELVSLLLQPSESELSQKTLIKARDVIESLQLAELDNFFREACLDAQPARIDRVDPQTAVIYPIILKDRLEVILTLPNQPLRHYTTFLAQDQVEEIIAKFRDGLTLRSKREYVSYGQQMYDWLIRPAEKDLENSQLQTIVFVLDGVLRNVPMAALQDGQKFLLEKYSVALTPGLQLLDSQLWSRADPQLLSAGLTEPRFGFPALENVTEELNEIQTKIPSVILLNQEFTSQNFQAEIDSNNFDIIHIATHGKFSSNAAETFILAWDEQLSINQLQRLLESNNKSRQKPLELIVFSACETATGDKRAALGLAGMAVKAGARSTLATLWSVSDEATAELMSQFYQNLPNTTVTKAEVLRQAQLSLLKNPLYKHPIYWAPYVLVGNWF